MTKAAINWTAQAENPVSSRLKAPTISAGSAPAPTYAPPSRGWEVVDLDSDGMWTDSAGVAFADSAGEQFQGSLIVRRGK